MAEMLSSSMENYLETIRNLGKDKGIVRVKNIAEELKVKMSSVSEALETLAKEGLISHEKYGYIELTDKGERLAKAICSRHWTLFKFLTEVLGVDPKTADEDACKMEHTVSPLVLEKLMEFVDSFSQRSQPS
ncbi:MAG: metal-dependent transcriptional regulator [bacterium]